MAPMATGPAPVVGLWAHRWGDLAGRTGVGRYALELTAALARHQGPLAYERRGGREPGSAAGQPVLRRSWPPRRALHAAWLAVGWPRLEQVAPPVDLLHVLFPSFPVPTGAPWVGTINDLVVLDHPGWYPAAEARAVRRSTERIAAEADRVVVISQHVGDQVASRLGVEPRRLAVVPLAPSSALSPHGPAGSSPSGRPYVLAVGAGIERKNLAVAVRAVAGVEGCDLLVAGPDGPATPALDALVRELGLADHVHRLGAVPDAELGALLRGAAALVHPSLDEGFGLPTIEAMAVGTPVLAARSGALPEVVGDAGVLLDPTDPDAWAGAIHRCLHDPEHRAALVAAGRARTASWTWDHVAAATAAVHEAVLRDHARL
jgi:glycosyltransferase involved in cell wall biosynthesis